MLVLTSALGQELPGGRAGHPHGRGRAAASSLLGRGHEDRSQEVGRRLGPGQCGDTEVRLCEAQQQHSALSSLQQCSLHTGAGEAGDRTTPTPNTQGQVSIIPTRYYWPSIIRTDQAFSRLKFFSRIVEQHLSETPQNTEFIKFLMDLGGLLAISTRINVFWTPAYSIILIRCVMLLKHKYLFHIHIQC